MADTNTTAMMPLTDWLDICKALNTAVGETFSICIGDVPNLLYELANGKTYRDWEEE